MASNIDSLLSNWTLQSDEEKEMEISAMEQNKNQNINDLMSIAELEREKYLKYKLMYDLLEEYIKSDDSDQQLKEKIKNIILANRTAQCLTLLSPEIPEMESSCSGTFNLLGLKNDSECRTLNFVESKKLTCALERALKERECCVENLKEVANFSPPPSFDEDETLFNLREKLLTEQKLYLQNLTKLKDVYEEMKNVRLNEVPETVDKNIQLWVFQEKINDLKTLISKRKLQIETFKETRISFAAYMELFDDLRTQIRDCEKEIQDLRNLKRKYEEVACKEYDEILESYIKMKALIERKKKINELNSNLN